jgi:hypothetical protein
MPANHRQATSAANRRSAAARFEHRREQVRERDDDDVSIARRQHRDQRAPQKGAFFT